MDRIYDVERMAELLLWACIGFAPVALVMLILAVGQR